MRHHRMKAQIKLKSDICAIVLLQNLTHVTKRS